MADSDNSPDTLLTLTDGLKITRSIVLIGLMGAGKTSIGRRLAVRLGLPFADADTEIEIAAGRSVSDIFEEFGEAAFRDGERKVIARLMDETPKILATGGGAFMDAETRTLIREHAISIWLKADITTLVERTSRRNTRPLLQDGNAEETLVRLAEMREPVYAEADLTVESDDGPHEQTVDAIVSALEQYLRRRPLERP